MESKGTQAAKKKMSFAEIYSRFGIFIILLGLIIIGCLLTPTFYSGRNIVNVLRQNVVIAVIAFGAQFIMIAGDIDLSAGSVCAFAGCAGAWFMQLMANAGHTSWVAMLAALVGGTLVGGLIGLLNGVVITGCKIPAFIMTLATQTAFRGIGYIVTGATPITGLPPSFAIIGQGDLFIGPVKIPLPILVLAVVFVVSWVLLNRTSFGRYVYAVGGNVEAARASGINTNWVRIKAFIYGGLMAGLAGFVLMSRVNSGQPNSAMAFEFDAITAVVIGGTSMSGGIGSVWGTLAGAYFVGVMNNIMTLMNVSAYYQQVAQGVIIAVAVIIDVSVRNAKKKQGA